MVPEDPGTLIRNDSVDDGTMIQHATLVPDKVTADVESDLGTMVINEDEDEDSMRSARKDVSFPFCFHVQM